MRALTFHQVDVFTDRPFQGNPLAVFTEAEGLTGAQMQAIAREMNLSETTFVLPSEGGGDVRVRIFTPVLELPFAGHPCIGTACELVRLGRVEAREPVTQVVLALESGLVTVEVAVRDGRPVSATVHQRAPVFRDPAPRAAAAAALGLDPEDLHPDLEPTPVDTGLCYAVVPLVSRSALGRVSLDLPSVAAFERRHAELYPCAFAEHAEYWMEARGLFPFAGIAEDPATGSAAGPLAAYMARAGVLPVEEERVVLQGARISRPSYLRVVVSGAPDAITGVRVGGQVAPVLSGELRLPD